MVPSCTSFDSHLTSLIIKSYSLREIKSIIAKKDLYNVKDNTNNTLLHIAANFGNVEIAQYLIDSGSKIDVQNTSGETPLISALKSHQPRRHMLKILMNAGADIHVCDNKGNNVLKMAGQLSWLSNENLRLFLEKLRTNCSNNQEDIAKKLFDAKWSLSKVVQLENAGLTKIMLQRGYISGINVISGYLRQTALHVAVKNTDVENVKVLLEYNASVNISDLSQQTPLYCLCDNYYHRSLDDDDVHLTLNDYENTDTVATFNYDYRDNYDNENDNSDDRNMFSEKLNRKFEIFKMLLERSSMKDIHVRHILNIFERGNVEAIKLLFRSNLINLLTFDCEGYNGTSDLLANEKLRKLRFKVNSYDHYGQTPLMCAAQLGHVSAIEFLLNEGADINTLDYDDKSVLALAVKSNLIEQEQNRECIQTLLIRGANIEMDYQESTIFEVIQDAENFLSGEVILAHLALQEAQGKFISKLVYSEIDSVQRFTDFFELSKQQLNLKIYDSITLFDLLITSDKIFERYARNHNLAVLFEGFIAKLSNNYYFSTVLQKRLTQTNAIILLKNEVHSILCKIVQISYERFPHIFDKILDNLEQKDMTNFIDTLAEKYNE